MEQLCKLHNSANRKAWDRAIIIGILGALILGTGMSFAMTDLGELLGSYSVYAMFIGVTTGIIGMVLAALAYPVYNGVLKKERRRIAPGDPAPDRRIDEIKVCSDC